MTQIYAPGTPNWVDLGSTDVPGATSPYFYNTATGPQKYFRLRP